MNRQKWILLAVVFVLLGAAAGFVQRWGKHQKPGVPGVKASPIPGSSQMEIYLPERVLDYTSVPVPATASVTNMLPKDTSLATRRFTASNDFWISLSVVMMGTDRTSIHKPEYCLPGQGWRIDQREAVKIPMAGPPQYELPAMFWTLSNKIQRENGQTADVRGIYVFWFTADNELTDSHYQRIWWLTRDLLLTGVLQRWSYVSYFAICVPGQEAAAVERMKQFVAASAQEFQLPPRTNGGAVAAH